MESEKTINNAAGQAVNVDPLVSAFSGMSDRESVAFQLKNWVDGNPLHNPIRGECCPDFSCCNGGNIMPVEVRQRFAEAFQAGNDAAQWEILSMGLGMLSVDSGIKIHVAGDGFIEH